MTVRRLLVAILLSIVVGLFAGSVSQTSSSRSDDFAVGSSSQILLENTYDLGPNFSTGSISSSDLGSVAGGVSTTVHATSGANTPTLGKTDAADSEFVDLTSPGVRSHILDGEARPNGTYGGGHRAGTGFPNKSEFPSSWSDDQIIHNLSDVATDPAATRTTVGGATFVTGTRDGIDIEVIIRDGENRTGYPTNTPRNP